MVDATVGIAIQKLSDFLIQQVNIRIGVKDGVRFLKDELVYLQSSISYAEARQEEELIRVWINNVRDVANEAVNILERFVDHKEKHAVRKKGVLERLWCSICMCKKESNLYDIGKEIESLKDEIAKIKTRREEYGISNILATQNVKQRKRTLLRATSFENQVDVVGFEEDVQTLLTQLVKEDPSLGYISIHGMGGGLGKTTLASKLQGQIRHAINNGLGEYLKLHEPSNLCSLALINKNYAADQVKIDKMMLMFTRFRYLKVLDLRRVESQGIPEEIGDIGSLKFLGLMRGISYKTLVIPPSIGMLRRLQTLCGFGFYEFPREICELKELRHLIFNGARSLEIGSHQTKLQTLENIEYNDWIKIDTVNLINLRTLFITKYKQGNQPPYTLDSIANLTSLQTFELYLKASLILTIKPLSYCKHLHTVTLICSMKDQSELRFLPDSVTHLTLWNTEITEDPMPTLGSLPNLTSLRLCFDPYEGDKMFFSRDAFPSLQFLSLGYINTLEEVQVEDGALPSLKGLTISGCQNLKMLPQRLKCIPPVPDIYSHMNL